MIKVVAADDEQYIRGALQTLVPWNTIGASLVKVCKNGRELINEIEEYHPHIVITDIRMPVMDGMEVCKYIYDNFPDIKVVVLTAYSDFNYARTAMKYDVFEYILKTDIVEELPEVIQRIVDILNAPSDGTKEPKDTEINLYDQIAQYLDLRYKEDFSLSDIANELHANPSYISRLYKKKTGKNLFDEVVSRRMDKAKEYLIASDMKINDIAEYVGFNDPSYFSRLFKKLYGITPKEYRTGKR